LPAPGDQNHVKQIGDDGIERVATQVVLDLLEVPQRTRRAGAYRRLAKVLSELGGRPFGSAGVTRGGYRGQVRGFCPR
jgi:hypothetical protein